MRVIGAGVGREAMVARRDVGRMPLGDQRLHGLGLMTDGFAHRVGLLKARVIAEQRVEVELPSVVDVVPVERQNARIAHIKPRAPHEAELKGEVEQEYVLVSGGGLDFDESPAVVGEALDDVGAGEKALVREGGFEQCREGVL